MQQEMQQPRAHLPHNECAAHLRAHKWWLRGHKRVNAVNISFVLRHPGTRRSFSFLPHPLPSPPASVPPLCPPFSQFAIFCLPFVDSLRTFCSPWCLSIIPPIFSAPFVFSWRILTSMAYCWAEWKACSRDGYTMTSYNVRIMNVRADGMRLSDCIK